MKERRGRGEEKGSGERREVITLKRDKCRCKRKRGQNPQRTKKNN